MCQELRASRNGCSLGDAWEGGHVFWYPSHTDLHVHQLGSWSEWWRPWTRRHSSLIWFFCWLRPWCVCWSMVLAALSLPPHPLVASPLRDNGLRGSMFLLCTHCWFTRSLESSFADLVVEIQEVDHPCITNTHAYHDSEYVLVWHFLSRSTSIVMQKSKFSRVCAILNIGN